jgi:hypothetical protein
MDLHDLLKIGGPVFHLLVDNDSEACDQVTALQHEAGNRLTMRTVRGRKADTLAGFFDESAAALQFPYYFGENWDAFNDCISDLEWLPGEGYVVIITHAISMLEKEPADALKQFITSSQHAAQHWHKPEKGKKAKPFNLILHAAQNEASSLKSKWQALGIPLSLS